MHLAAGASFTQPLRKKYAIQSIYATCFTIKTPGIYDMLFCLVASIDCFRMNDDHQHHDKEEEILFLRRKMYYRLLP